MLNKRLAADHLLMILLVVAGLGALITLPACGCSARDQVPSAPASTAISSGKATSMWTPTVTLAPEEIGAATQAPTMTATLVPTMAAMHTPTRGGTQTPDSMPSPSSTLAPDSTPTLLPTITPTLVPTPIACDDLGALTWIEIAPGQRFECTTHQDTITEELRNIPEVPCGDVLVLFEDGQFSFICKGRMTVTVKGAIAAQDCQIDVQITGGTPGVGGAMQVLIDTLLNYFPYEKLCFERAELVDGELIVSGYGR